MVKRTGKTTGASDLAQCGECTRWCYLDETAFTSLADAEEASFVCKLCQKVKAAVQRMGACIGELKVEREQRIELQLAQLGEARERGEAPASLVEQMEADLRKERERRAELEDRKQATAGEKATAMWRGSLPVGQSKEHRQRALYRESGTLSERGIISGREQDHSNRKPEANDWTVEGS
ncbi:hypothetical protein HPB52_002347 [Rhipicephalus sanguineus]|uniref:Uncharacterized protein n=1 Tax=Rhipicephalus sanguineus TaxID=34632 RepID=A0A9D4Q3W1_RHISA|nr:hypothetical protein HPB52_002347 [Rhipicephalus sanguineus]